MALLPALPPLPVLPTLGEPASWLTCHGRVDRAACAEVRAAWVWKDQRFDIDCPTLSGRQASAIVRFTAGYLAALLDEFEPRRLAGDWRQGRARALRPAGYIPKRRRQVSLRSFRLGGPGPDAELTHNPNRGAGRTKIPGVTDAWWQALRLERWYYSERQGPRGPRKRGGRVRPWYFLICPGHGGVPGSLYQDRLGGADRASRLSGFDLLRSADRDDPRLPPLSTAPRGTAPRGHCPQRVRMLYLPLCTPAEARDAALAQQWLESVARARPGAPGTAIEAKLIERYRLLFQPRMLLCGTCLNLYWASDPFKAHANRARWKLRQGQGAKLTSNERRALGLIEPAEGCDVQAGARRSVERAPALNEQRAQREQDATDEAAMAAFFELVENLRRAADEVDHARRLAGGHGGGG